MSLSEGVTAVVAVLAPLAAGGGGVWAWLSAREKARASRPVEALKAEADMTEAAANFAKQFGAAAAALVDDLRGELRFVRADQAASRQEMVALKAQFDQCEQHRIDCDANLAAVRAEIAQLMRENPPAAHTFPPDHGAAI